MEFWQTITATVLGGAITLIATVMTNNHQKSLDRDKRRLEKIEKAHELLSKIEHSYRMAWASDVASLNSGKYEERFRIKEKLPFEELEMLIGFYAPEVKEDVSKLVELSKNKYGVLSSRIAGIEMISNDEAEALKQDLTTSFHDIKNSIKIMQEKLVKAGNLIA